MALRCANKNGIALPDIQEHYLQFRLRKTGNGQAPPCYKKNLKQQGHQEMKRPDPVLEAVIKGQKNPPSPGQQSQKGIEDDYFA